MRSAFVSFAGGVAVLVAAMGWGFGVSSHVTVHSLSGEQFLVSVEQARKGKTADVWKKSGSPLAAKLVERFASGSSSSMVDTTRTLCVASIALLAVLIYLSSLALMPWYFALAPPLLFLLHPQVSAASMHTAPVGFVLLFLLGPPLLATTSAASRGGARIALIALAGGGAGLSIFAHHLGLWTSLATFIFLVPALGRITLEQGRLELPPVAIELTTFLASLLASFVAAASLLAPHGKELPAFLLGPLKAAHPYISAASAGFKGAERPAWWTTFFLLGVRTPPLLLLGGAGGVWFVSKNFHEQNVRVLWPSAGVFLALVILSILKGSPLYYPGLSLLSPLSLFPVLLAGFALTCVYRMVTRSGFRNRLPGAALATFLAVAALSSQAYTAGHLHPYPQAYANLFGSGTGGFLARGNSFFIEPTFDSKLARIAQKQGPKLVVSPWGSSSSPVIKRLVQLTPHWPWERGGPVRAAAPEARNGGPFPLLLIRGAASGHTAILERYCNSGVEVASLRLESFPIWKVVRFEGPKRSCEGTK